MKLAACLTTALALLASAPAESDPRPGSELIDAQVRALELDALAPGAAGELSLVLLERPDPDMPLELRVEDVGELELEDNRFDWSAVVDPLALQPRLRAAFQAPEQPGSYRVSATVDYSVCSERWCRRKSGRVEWVVRVEAPAAD